MTILAVDRPAIADAAIRPGQVDVYEWRDDGDRRHTLVIAGFRPAPWTAFARAKRQTTGQPYASWKAAMHDHVKAALLRAGTAPYPRTAVLGLAMAFGARPMVMPGQQRATSIRSFDYTNLFKAAEDVLSGLLFHDDQQARYHGPGAARDDTADYFAVHAWDGDQEWLESWRAHSVPGIEVVR